MSGVEGIVTPLGLWHTCEDGHSWREQPDGGVSPSWGLGLTSVHYDDWDPASCPEPRRAADRRITCEGCGERYVCGHGTPGVMTDPWNYDERCQPAPPACGKPPVQTLEWVHGTGRGKNRTYGNWVEIGVPGQQLELLGAAA